MDSVRENKQHLGGKTMIIYEPVRDKTNNLGF